MAFHTLAEFVATILIMLIGSGSVIGGMVLYFKLRDKEMEAMDSREAEARLRTVEMRLGAMEDAIGALVAGLAQPPAPPRDSREISIAATHTEETKPGVRGPPLTSSSG